MRNQTTKATDKPSEVLKYARRIVEEILPELKPEHRGRVHFRPSSTGIRAVCLDPERPQLDLGRSTKAATILKEYPQRLLEGREADRKTPEKRVQSYLISKAYLHDRRAMVDLPGAPLFVTDELAYESSNGKTVCDILAFDEAEGRPVIVELKSDRLKLRLVEQLNSYAKIIKDNAHFFEELFSILLNGRVRTFDARNPRRILVWREGDDKPYLSEFKDAGIEAVQYRSPPEYLFRSSQG